MNRAPAAAHSAPGMTAKIALAVTLASETFFFGTLVSAFLFMRGTQPWLVEHTLARLALPIANTVILLVSALLVNLGVRAMRRGNLRGLQQWFGISLGLGLLFVGLQVLEFTSSGLLPSDAGFGGVFFTLMGFHAVHMLAGVFVHALVLNMAAKGDFDAARHTPVQIAAWFWYYVVGVWVVLFTVLYLV